MKKLCFLVLGLALIPAVGFPAGSNFSIKVGGGLGYSFIGEINDALRDYPVYMRTHELNVRDDFGPVHFGPSFSLEAVYSLNPSLSLGLGVGCGSAQRKNSIHREYSTVSVDETWTPKVCFVPVALSGYYTLPLTSKWAVVLGGGLSYNFATLTFEEDAKEERPSGNNSFNRVFRAGQGALGIQASATLEMNISPLLSVFVSGSFRLASASGFTGKSEIKWTEDGDSGSYTEENQTFWISTYHYDGVEYQFHDFDETAPSGAPIYTDAHKGKVNIGGAALGIGARIKL